MTATSKPSPKVAPPFTTHVLQRDDVEARHNLCCGHGPKASKVELGAVARPATHFSVSGPQFFRVQVLISKLRPSGRFCGMVSSSSAARRQPSRLRLPLVPRGRRSGAGGHLPMIEWRGDQVKTQRGRKSADQTAIVLSVRRTSAKLSRIEVSARHCLLA